MLKRLPVLFRSVIYSFRGGFLIRPFLIVLTLGAAGAVLSALEERFPHVRQLVPEVLFPSQEDPQVAQAILTSIATSTMTVVSIVFAILLMTLTLASTQFSPRILISFVRDHVTQWTLGIFLGVDLVFAGASWIGLGLGLRSDGVTDGSRKDSGGRRFKRT